MPPYQGKTRNNTAALPVLKNYLQALSKYPWVTAALVLSLIGAQAMELAGPYVLKHFIDLISQGAADHAVTAALLLSLVLYGGIRFIEWLFYRMQMMTENRIENDVQRDLTNQAFAYLIRHSHDFFINNFAGTLTRRVSRYARSFPQVFQSIVINMFPTAVFAIGVILVLSMRNTMLAVALLAWSVFFVALQFVMTRWRYRYKLERALQDSRLTGALSDSIGNHSAVLFFATEPSESAQIGEVVNDWHTASRRAWNADIWNYAVQGMVTRVGQIALLAASLYLWSRGQFTVGDIILIQLYMFVLMERTGSIGSSLRQLYDAYAEANEMIEILEEPHGIQDDPTAVPLAISTGEVAFDKVGFGFDPARPILKSFDLTVAGREKVALVGPSGAGKSTITKLLLRLYDIDSGAIKIDGTDIRQVSLESLRKAIAFVPQEPVLFHRTLQDNIAYGKQGATLDEVIEAARKARCHEFISQLPHGYDTYVGERGVKLSGGERQRVAIARAILKNAPILVLDEATSSLDSESEHLIQEALDTLMEGKTVIVIAHRLSTIMRMDRIVVMEGGKIVAQGTHQELLAQGGLYKKLWSIQAGGFLGGEEAKEPDTEPEEEGEETV